MLILVPLLALTGAAVAATVIAVRDDGYCRRATRADYDSRAPLP